MQLRTTGLHRKELDALSQPHLLGDARRPATRYGRSRYFLAIVTEYVCGLWLGVGGELHGRREFLARAVQNTIPRIEHDAALRSEIHTIESMILR